MATLRWSADTIAAADAAVAFREPVAGRRSAEIRVDHPSPIGGNDIYHVHLRLDRKRPYSDEHVRYRFRWNIIFGDETLITLIHYFKT